MIREQKVSGMYGTSGWPETYIIDRQGVRAQKVYWCDRLEFAGGYAVLDQAVAMVLR